MKSLSVYFFGQPGGELEKTLHRVLRRHRGKFIGQGTTLSTGERDVQYDVPDDEYEFLKRHINRLGMSMTYWFEPNGWDNDILDTAATSEAKIRQTCANHDG